MDTATADDIIATLKPLIKDLAPNVRFVPKYGGEVMCPDPESDKHFVGGIFAFNDHVSLEFSEGASLDDPAKLLEGKGKARRHLKFQTVEDVTAKDAKWFLHHPLAGPLYDTIEQ